MAKKKKHRKTKQRKQQLAQRRAQSVAHPISGKSDTKSDSNEVIAAKSVSTSSAKKNQFAAATREDSVTTEELAYVKADVRTTLLLLGVILAAFAVLYVVLEMTGFGTKVYSLIKF